MATTITPFSRTKFRVPALRPELLDRPRLLRDMDLGGAQVILLAAPAGYGKSTLVAQWLERAPGPVAWVSLDSDDDTLAGFWSALVSGLEAALGEPAAPLARDVRSAWTDVRGVVLLPLLDLLAGLEEPVTLVLDDLHLITHETALASFDWLLRRLPPPVRVVLATRRRPDLPALASLRIHGQAVEIATERLRFDPSEAHAFLAGSLGLELGARDAERLLGAFDGWPAAMYLASLRLRGGASLDAVLTGAARSNVVGRALAAEVLGTYDPRVAGFLLRLSVFERFSIQAAAEVLEAPDAHALLAELRETNLLVLPLETGGHWLRLHHLLRDLLREELARVSPKLARELSVRAGDWFLEHGDLRAAIGHYLAGEAWDQLARLLVENVIQLITAGAWELVNADIAAIPEEVIKRDPRLCYVAAYAALYCGDQATSLVWRRAGRACAREGELLDGIHDWPTLEAWMRGCLPFRDVGSAVVAGMQARELLSERSPYLPVLVFCVGIDLCLAGDWERAEAWLEEAAQIMQRSPNEAGEAIVPAWRALVRMAAGDYDAAAPLVARAVTARAATAYANEPYSAGVLIAGARWSTHSGRPAEALEACRQGLNITRGWSDTQLLVPCLLIEQARAQAALGRVEEAAESLEEAQRRLDGYVDAGVVPDWLEEVRGLLPAPAQASASLSARARERDDLSQRELEVLQMLAGPLTGPEIASELFVSRNTLKSHCKSLYRKLGVRSRPAAVARARELTLIG